MAYHDYMRIDEISAMRLKKVLILIVVTMLLTGCVVFTGVNGVFRSVGGGLGTLGGHAP